MPEVSFNSFGWSGENGLYCTKVFILPESGLQSLGFHSL